MAKTQIITISGAYEINPGFPAVVRHLKDGADKGVLSYSTPTGRVAFLRENIQAVVETGEADGPEPDPEG